MAVKRKRVTRKRSSKRSKKKVGKKRSTRKARGRRRLAGKGARKPRGSSSKQGIQSPVPKKENDDLSGSVPPMNREDEKNPEITNTQPIKMDVNDLENWPKIGLFGDEQNTENLLNQVMAVPPQHPSLMLGLPGGNMMAPHMPAGMMPPPLMPGMMMPTPEQYIQMLAASGAPPGQFFPFNLFQNMPDEKEGHGTLRQVFHGKKKFTRGGLTKKDLIINARGKVVSKKMSANAKKKNVKAMLWCTSVKQARKELKIVGFIKINRGEKGVKLYQRAKKIFAELTKDMPARKKSSKKKMAKKKKKTTDVNVFAALKETPVKIEPMSLIKES